MSNLKNILNEVELILPEDSPIEVNYSLENGSNETLELSSPKREEKFTLKYDGSDTFTVNYEGRTEIMRETIGELRLSNSRQELGEIVFHYFKGLLETESRDHTELNKDIYSGQEGKLVPTIKKLAWVYSDKEVGPEFYSRA